MSKLRKSADGQSCMVRLPGICNFDESTTVLAHINGGGMGMKKNDLFAAFCCSTCHDAIDRRMRTSFLPGELKLMHWEGVERTQQYWLDHGYIEIA